MKGTEPWSFVPLPLEIPCFMIGAEHERLRPQDRDLLGDVSDLMPSLKCLLLTLE